MRLGDLIAGLSVRPSGLLVAGLPGVHNDDLRRFADVRVCDLTEDSRTVVPGSLFVARSGFKADGKRYLVAALEAGAVAALTDDPILTSPAGFDVPVLYAKDIRQVTGAMAERFYGSPSNTLRLVGVTGTNGKTTITYLIWQLLNSIGHRAGLVGTVLVDDGVEVAPANMTTPPSIETSRTLSLMLEGSCRSAALEVSSHALDQKRADALRFLVAVFSNLTGDHLDYHKTIDNYAWAKSRLFERLPLEGTAILNAADPWANRMVRRCKARVLRCAVVATDQDTKPECRIQVLEESLGGMLVRLVGPWGDFQASVPLVGRHNAMNILQTVASCHALGVNEADLARGLAQVSAPPGRFERVSEPGDGFSVFVDYAHSDDSLRHVLSAAGAVMPGRRSAGGAVRGAAGAPVDTNPGGALWVVFGCGGERDRTKRARMGLAASELADRVVVTSDNPRSERPSDIVDQVLAGIPADARDRVVVQIDRARAIRLAIESAQAGDVVVIAGKGHETEQILPDGSGGTIRLHFDDREIARTILAELRPPRAQAARTKRPVLNAAPGILGTPTHSPRSSHGPHTTSIAHTAGTGRLAHPRRPG